jgi:hypothetical protein
MGPLDAELATLETRIEKNKAALKRNNVKLAVKMAELCKRTRR